MTEHAISENAAAYALGALEAPERREFLSHLATCRSCRSEVASLLETVALIGLAAPEATPPAALRSRVLSAVRRRPAARVWVAVAAGLAVVAVASAIAGNAIRRVARIEQAMSGARLHHVTLSPPGMEPALRIFWNHDRDVFVVTVLGLPPTPKSRTYQLWALAEGRDPVSMGTFAVGPGRRPVLLLPVSREVNALGLIQRCALTEEPEGGSPQPTETPRMLGTWVHGELHVPMLAPDSTR